MAEIRAHRVVAVVNPSQSTFELSGAAEVFGPHRADLPARYEFEVCTEHPGPMPTLAGYDMLVTADLAALQAAHTVVIPGWQAEGTPASPTLIESVRTAHRRGARIIALCTGAFVLAQAGLLDGRRATTHWLKLTELAERFPNVEVDRDVLYVDHGDVATSAGTAAAIDLCLHLLAVDHGAAYAAQVARRMVMPPHREGGQLQYATPHQPATPVSTVTDSLAPLLEWITTHLHQPLTVNDMAAQAGLSNRTLARRFSDQLGTSPGQWLLAQRITATRALLEQTDLPIDTIATRVGLSSATNLRRRFSTALRTTPAAYRRAFKLKSP